VDPRLLQGWECLTAILWMVHHTVWGTWERSGWGTMLHGTSWVWVPMRSLNYFDLSNPSSRTRPWGLLSL
jgi:hypothetical protein